MSKRTNQLVEIAKILIELKAERDYHDIPVSIRSRYPEGSQGILIDEEKYIVLNSSATHVVSASDQFNELKDSSLKYNPSFYLSTHQSDEPDIIDETHNKSKLITQAYTEVSFLPKDIVSLAEFDPNEGKAALRKIIDRNQLSKVDFDDYRVEKPTYTSGNVYDEIYRCRCIFHDITGNESVESLLIKAYKVSNVKDEEFSYSVVSSDNIIEYIEKLENLVSEDDSNNMRAEYPKISASEYAAIAKHIQEGIEKYYEVNSKKYYRLTRVEIKAIYCLRLKKIPIDLNLLVDNSVVAKMNTYYSMVSNDLNVFTCPNCNTLSSEAKNAEGLKIHIDHDYTNMEEEMLGIKMHIGCTDCMEQCPRCGSWHFRLSDYANVISKGFSPINKRVFLKHFVNKDIHVESLCACKEHLTWIYDEMSMVKKAGKTYYGNIIDKFLSGSCRLTFVNFLTGEAVASYRDYLRFLYLYLVFYLKSKPEVYAQFVDSKDSVVDDDLMKARIFNFVDTYMLNENGQFDHFEFAKYIEQSIGDYKKNLAKAYNLPAELIKVTSANKTTTCRSCGGFYFTDTNHNGESYFNPVKNLCFCCDEAEGQGYSSWVREDDGVIFYKSKDKEKAIRTYLSNRGEELYEEWSGRVLADLARLYKKD